MKRRTLLSWGAAASMLPPVAMGKTDAWPSRPLRIVVGFPPGGSTDTIARALAISLADFLGQSVIVENKPGASAQIAAEYTIHATDQHTVFLHPAGIHSLRPHVTTLRFDPWQDLQMLTTLAIVPNLFVCSSKKPYKNLADLAAYGRSADDKLNMAMAGNATQTHLTSELLRRDAKLPAVAIPFNGAAPALQALLAGSVDVVAVDASAALPHIRAGRMTGLAVAARQRYAFLPDVPTTVEAGYPNVIGRSAYGLHTPATISDVNRQQLLVAVHKALKEPALAAAFRTGGLEPQGSTPAEYVELAREDEARYAPLIKSLGLRMQ
jgi:tripartite-type tricarboxylate transporter receptor subunit TctC